VCGGGTGLRRLCLRSQSGRVPAQLGVELLALLELLHEDRHRVPPRLVAGEQRGERLLAVLDRTVQLLLDGEEVVLGVDLGEELAQVFRRQLRCRGLVRGPDQEVEVVRQQAMEPTERRWRRRSPAGWPEESMGEASAHRSIGDDLEAAEGFELALETGDFRGFHESRTILFPRIKIPSPVRTSAIGGGPGDVFSEGEDAGMFHEVTGEAAFQREGDLFGEGLGDGELEVVLS